MSTRKSTFVYSVLIAFSSLVVGMVVASRLDLAPSSFANTLNVPVTNSAPLTGPIDASTFRTIAHDASPTVVSIRVTSRREVPEINELFGFQNPFGGRRGQPAPAEPRERIQQGAGSGFIIDTAGYILTNNHVVADAESIEVFLVNMSAELNETGYSAKVVGRDSLTDTALLQLTEMPDQPLIASKFGDSSIMAPGDWVMAIGNPFSLNNTVTVGVVSAVGRQNQVAQQRYEDFIQTDAAINRGNSGGPLLNIRGEVVGINTMILSDQGGGNVGVGFAIPINTVRDLLPQLRTGKVTRGRIGVTVSRRTMTKSYAEELGLTSAGGAEVRTVDAGPARDAGMRAGDVIVEFNGKAVKDNNELVSLVTRTAPGTTVPVKIVRNRKPLTLNVKVAELSLADEAPATASASPRTEREVPRSTSFGMTIQPVSPRDQARLQLPQGTVAGAVVAEVTDFGAASQAGILEGDIITSIQGQPVRTVDEVSAALDAVASGRTARIIVWRPSRTGSGGEELLIPVRKR
jgi:serine protease Do